MKKFKKFLFVLLAIIIVLPCSIFLGGCSLFETVSISSIEKTGTSGLIDTYTIYYTDGTTSTFTITNGQDGKDGEDGKDVTIEQAYNKYVEEQGEISYSDFLKIYLSLNLGGNTATINQCLLSCLKIYTEFTETTTLIYNQKIKNVAIYTGSAVIWKMDDDYTYVITNFHVIYDANANADNGSFIARKIYGYLYGSEGQPSKTNSVDSLGYSIYDYGDYGIQFEYIGGSISSDIAVLRTNTSAVKQINENAKAVSFAEGYRVGETAIAIGNPEDEGISVTEGIVSVDNEFISLDIDGTTRSYRSIRIDTALYSGNSGGGLFNVDGQLIGITNAGDSADQNVNYAIPIGIVKYTAENILYYYNQTGTASNGYKIQIGIKVVTENSKYIYQSALGYGKIVEDVIIDEIVENSIAETLEIKQLDTVKAIYIDAVRYEIERYFNISDILLNIRANNKIKFELLRDDNLITTEEYIVQTSDLISLDWFLKVFLQTLYLFLNFA